MRPADEVLRREGAHGQDEAREEGAEREEDVLQPETGRWRDVPGVERVSLSPSDPQDPGSVVQLVGVEFVHQAALEGAEEDGVKRWS